MTLPDRIVPRSKPIEAVGHQAVQSGFRLIVALLLSFVLTGCSPSPSSVDPGVVGDGKFSAIIKKIVRDLNIPALSVIVIQDNQLLESAAVGLRSFGRSVRVDQDDQWQIGSVTKAMTATLVARLVDTGLLRWDTRIDESFSEHLDQINTELHDITIAELLQHRAGLTEHPIPTTQERDNNDRLGFLLRTLNTSLGSDRGQFSYSNFGYLVAGVMVEKATGMSWENAMGSYLLTELGVDNYGFGVPDPGADLSQPVGHIKRFSTSDDRVNDYWFPVVPSEDTFLSQLKLYGPAGSLYLDKRAYQLFQQLHLDGVNNRSTFLSQSSFERLHTTGNGFEYAMGWYDETAEFLDQFNLSDDERVLAHAGSTGTWSAYSILLPDRNISIFMALNSSNGDQASILKILLKRLSII